MQAFIEEKIADAFPHRRLFRSFHPSPQPAHCPFCSVELKREETEVLIRSFCLDCGFVDYRFTQNRKAALRALSGIHDRLTGEEYGAIEDALDDRISRLICEFDFDYQRAMQAAENDVLPRVFASYFNRLEFNQCSIEFDENSN